MYQRRNNLRCSVIPVLDLRKKFRINERAYDERTCIIVVETSGESGDTIMLGIIVDSVSEVLNIAGTEIEPSPRFNTESSRASNLLGMALKLKMRLKYCLISKASLMAQ